MAVIQIAGDAIAAADAALAQPEQEPIGWVDPIDLMRLKHCAFMSIGVEGGWGGNQKDFPQKAPIYTAPPVPARVPMTPDEMRNLIGWKMTTHEVVRAVEAYHGIGKETP